ncbi:MAG: RecX family transcriptional regulator [Sphingomonadaceae bacterium]
MKPNRHNSPRPPLDLPALEGLALRYVGRYATTEAKLARYLQRKIVERGWGDEDAADIAALVARFAAAGYVDDRAFAEGRAGALARRGYGGRRIGAALAAAGVDRAIGEALRPCPDAAYRAAETYARRRRFGPFAVTRATPEVARRQIAAMIRAGHDFGLARAFVLSLPGVIPMRDQ